MNILFDSFLKTPLERTLAAAPKDIVLDYSIFSVGFTVLALILVVEIARHKLDHFALHKPLLKSILVACYTELSALGIVETFVFLLQKYATYDKESKYIFGQFHFMFFFVAIFNALSTSVMAYFSYQFSKVMWVQAEEVELDYYLGLRSKYEELVSCLKDKGMGDIVDNGYFSKFNLKFFLSICKRIRNHQLLSRYQKLVLPIRFHEMRVHFLLANDLPSNFRISNYLKNCELQTLIHFSHIGLFSWLGLMAGFTLLFYILGLLELRKEGEENTLILFINYSLLTGCFTCVFLCVIILRKVKSIFNTIISAKLIDRTFDEKFDEMSLNSSEISTSIQMGKNRNQLELFWNATPQLIVQLVQTVQFYFCITGSFIFLFWDTKIIDEKTWYLAKVLVSSCAVCYVICLLLIAKILPIYTMCTSLGQLSNKHKLAEAKAMYRLELLQKRLSYEEEQEKIEEKLEFEIEEKSMMRSIRRMRVEQQIDEGTHKYGEDEDDNQKSVNEDSTDSQRFEKLSNMVLMTTNQLQRKYSEMSLSMSIGSNKMRKSNSGGVLEMKNLSSSMRNMFPRVQSTESLSSVSDNNCVVSSKDKPLPSKFWRKKSTSTGVNFMRGNIQVNEDRTKIKRSSSGGALSTHLENISSKANLSDNATSGNGMCHKMDSNVEANLKEGSVILPRPYDKNDTMLPAFQHASKHEKGDTRLSKICSFLAGKQYRVSSYAFGTLPCLFIIGMRLENLLVYEGQVYVSTNTWNLSLAGAFALEFFWLCCFILVATVIIFLFSCGAGKSYPNRTQMIISAFYDIFITGGVLSLLILSEKQRCCEKPFGANIGVGNLEPYTGIIFLRLFRFYFASQTHSFWNQTVKGKKKSKTPAIKRGSIAVSHSNLNMDDTVENSEVESHSSHGGHHGGIQGREGTIHELWYSAVSLHPEIVKAYGEFSGEMLKSMLGLHVNTRHAKKRVNTKMMTSEIEDKIGSIHLENRFVVYDNDVLEIICAGKVGKPVKIVKRPKNVFARGVNIPDFKLDIEINKGKLLKEEKEDLLSKVSLLNARLIRDLRRCEFRLFPALEEWTIVDVALTKYEIILLKVSKDEEKGFSVKCNYTPDQLTKQKVNVREAIRATHGGRGLRLRDIVIGRTIVGHISVKDICSSTVDKILNPVMQTLYPTPSSSYADDYHLGKDIESGINNLNLRNTPNIAKEYWLEDISILEDKIQQHEKLGKFDENRLKIETCHGNSLHLRFLSDLESSRSLSQDSEIPKSNALIWCQTVIRICDPDVLVQHLPNLGQELEEKDLVHVIHRSNKENRSKGKSQVKFARRQSL